MTRLDWLWLLVLSTVLLACLSSCTWTVKVVPVPAEDRVAWEQKVTQRINEHELRLQRLEEQTNGK